MKNTLILTLFTLTLLGSFQSMNAQNDTASVKSIKKLIAKKRSYNKLNGYGYTVQIYNGTETVAKNKLENFKLLYPNIQSKLVYDDPEWKVQAGNYKTKLDADRAILIFKKEFSNIIVVPLKN
ncbi:hypothetical protein [Polaribacter tangerinus]|uniref:hypothetical protein n=1 Tax=Polaribacter tangerinus TaxID=1920034 RepID=UPI000B4A5FFC|nr:hypothetical protein [Polaribacter tangerinus]